MDTNGIRKVEAEARERLKSRKPLGWPRERERLLYENEQLEAQVARLREALEALEWVRVTYRDEVATLCPWCDGVQELDGHKEDCKRQAALSQSSLHWLTHHDEEVRKQCIREVEALAEKWFADRRRAWGMAAGECAAKLEANSAIREADA